MTRPFLASLTSTLPLSVTLKEASWGFSLNSSACSSRTLLALSLSYAASAVDEAYSVGEVLEHVPPSSDGVGFVHRRGRVHLYAEVVTAYGEPLFTGAEGDLLEGRRGVVPHGFAGLVSGHPANVDGADADAAVDLVFSPGQVVNGDGPDQQETRDQGYARSLALAGVARLPALTLHCPCCLVVIPPGGVRSTRLAYLFQVVAPP